MHYSMYVIIGNTGDISNQVREAMSPHFELHWDWYVIGGRWDGYIHGKETDHDPYDENRAEMNVLRVEDLLNSPLEERLPYGILTPYSQWMTGKETVYGPNGMVEREDPDWCGTVRNILKAFPNHRVVCVDIHN